MVTKIEIQHQGRTVWTKEDDNILDPKDISIRVVLKPQREEKIILPPGYIKDY